MSSIASAILVTSAAVIVGLSAGIRSSGVARRLAVGITSSPSSEILALPVYFQLSEDSRPPVRPSLQYTWNSSSSEVVGFAGAMTVAVHNYDDWVTLWYVALAWLNLSWAFEEALRGRRNDHSN